MTATANIVDAFQRATAADLAVGLSWYDRAHDAAGHIGLGRYSRDTVAGVIAALSPMMSWRANLLVAERLIARHASGQPQPTKGYGLTRNVAKAWAILNGACPLETLSGPKVRSFYLNIIGDADAVTVDRWAARIARGDLDDRGLVTAREYREIEAAFREAAEILGVSARTVQAATWVAARRTLGHDHYDPR